MCPAAEFVPQGDSALDDPYDFIVTKLSLPHQFAGNQLDVRPLVLDHHSGERHDGLDVGWCISNSDPSYFPAQKAVFGRPCNEARRADPPAARHRQVVK
jgi:hypothetical protein